jgi:hypothetical protein
MFSAAQPRLSYRWLSSGSTTGQRREKSGSTSIEPASSRNFHGWLLWLDGASTAMRTISRRFGCASGLAAIGRRMEWAIR